MLFTVSTEIHGERRYYKGDSSALAISGPSTMWGVIGSEQRPAREVSLFSAVQVAWGAAYGGGNNTKIHYVPSRKLNALRQTVRALFN